MTIYAATVVDTPGDPFAGEPEAALAEDGALLVQDLSLIHISEPTRPY